MEIRASEISDILKAQIAGDVTNLDEAKGFVKRYAQEERLV